ncbi:general stress protein [Parvibaculum sp.]|uniref:general stress protein n=1 Tax=Parvibaculum sp. TaxID=2024848 RepID=UPI00345DE63E
MRPSGFASPGSPKCGGPMHPTKGTSLMASTQHRGGSGNFAANPERAAQAGRKGGRMSGGNFRNNPERAAQAGQKGGQASGGNFRNDPKRAAQAGRKGGQETGSEAGQENHEAAAPQHGEVSNDGPAVDVTGTAPNVKIDE